MFINSTNTVNFGFKKDHVLLLYKYAIYDVWQCWRTNRFFTNRRYIKIYRKFKRKFFFHYSSLKNCLVNLNLRIKFKHRRLKKRRLFRLRFLRLRRFQFRSLSFKPSFLIKYKLRKINRRNIFKIVLRSRRLLRILWDRFKWRSGRLTTVLLKIFKRLAARMSVTIQLLPTVLVTSGLAANILDAYYWIRNKLVTVNHKSVTHPYQFLKPGDVVWFSPCLFAAQFHMYFKTVYGRWLKRRKRKNLRKLNKFINHNTNPVHIKKRLARWLLGVKLDKHNRWNIEIDYKANLLCCFERKVVAINNTSWNIVQRSLGVFNLWYYRF